MLLLKEREGMEVWQDGDLVIKVAKDEANRKALKNSWRFLRLLNGRYAPQPVNFNGTDVLKMEFVQGDSPEARSPEGIEFIRMNATHLIYYLREKNVIHGDLTHVNFILRDWYPVVIDWDQAIFSWEAKPQKRPMPDAHHLYRALCDMKLDPSRVLRRWRAIREEVEYYLGWGSLLDIGTHRGDFCGLAAAEGMSAVGIDSERIRPCIEDAKKYWGYMGCTFHEANIGDDPLLAWQHKIKTDVILLLSTWPYIVQDFGIDVAKEVLRKCIKYSNIFIFETQLFGDGPGAEITKTLEDVEGLLQECGAVQIKRLITIPVGGRDAERTLFSVRSD